MTVSDSFTSLSFCKSTTVTLSLIQHTALSIPTQASITYMAAQEVWKQEMPSWFPFLQYNLYFSGLRESVNSLRQWIGKKKIKSLSHCHVHTKWELSAQCNQAYGKQFQCLYNRSKKGHSALAFQNLMCYFFFQIGRISWFWFCFLLKHEKNSLVSLHLWTLVRLELS